MIKTRRIKLKLNHDDFKLLQQHSMEAANCWNEIVRLSKEYYSENNGWISKSDLQKSIKGMFGLHSQTIQGLTDVFCANRLTIARLRRNGDKKARYPYREKKFLTIPFKQKAINQSENNLKLTLSRGNYINIKINSLPEIRTAQLVWDNGYYLYYTAEYDTCDLSGDKTCGIDLGEVHSVAMVVETGESLVIPNRLGRSIKRYRNKKLGEFYKKLHRCTKGSRQWKKLIKAKHRMKRRTKNQLQNLYHQTTKKAVDFAVANNVGEIVCGNPDGVGKNTRKKKSTGRKNRQKLSQMEYGTLKDYLKYKAEQAGIIFSLVDESYTSQTCPASSEHKNHPVGRNYVCSVCGYQAHRDAVGAFNILRKKHQVELVDFVVQFVHPVKVSYQ